MEGFKDGEADGTTVGDKVVGSALGLEEGDCDGCPDGEYVGDTKVGVPDGLRVGT